MNKRELLKAISAAQKKVADEIGFNASRGGIYASGLSNEGWAGGYQQALADVQALLQHGYPSDPRNYWRAKP